MTSNHHAPYDLGLTRTTMAVNRGKQSREVERTPKSSLSSDCRLQPAYMKSELLVIADQHAAVNTFPGLVPVSYTHLDVYKRQKYTCARAVCQVALIILT